MNKKQNKSRAVFEVPELVAELDEKIKSIRDKGIKVLYFNHDKLVYDRRGISGYNLKTRMVVAPTIGNEAQEIVVQDKFLSTNRLEVIEKLSKTSIEDIFKDGNVYAYLTEDNTFVCSDSSKTRKLNFKDPEDSGLSVYYNSNYKNNEYAKYLVAEFNGQYSICEECKTLLLDPLDFAVVYGKNMCLDCIHKLKKEDMVDPNHYKLMKLHEIEKQM